MKEIENIFSSKKPKEDYPNKNNPIIMDSREKNSMILANLIEQKANIKIQKLEIGDYLINEMTIERKTISDLINSLKTNRLKEQLKNLKNCEKPLIILEKDKQENTYSNINPNTINGIIISITLNHNIPIIYTFSEKHTSQILIQIAKQEKKETAINQNKIPKTINEQKRFVLESFPGIGPKSSKELVKKYKSLKEIFNANEQELAQSLNQKILKKLTEILNS